MYTVHVQYMRGGVAMSSFSSSFLSSIASIYAIHTFFMCAVYRILVDR